jgi:hypothetical protein
MLNLLNKVALYNFLSSFSGTHFCNTQDSPGADRFPLLAVTTKSDYFMGDISQNSERLGRRCTLSPFGESSTLEVKNQYFG